MFGAADWTGDSMEDMEKDLVVPVWFLEDRNIELPLFGGRPGAT